MFSKVFSATQSTNSISATIRVGLAAVVLMSASAGVAAGSASAHSFNPADSVNRAPNIEAKALCRVDGHLVVWHPPMSYGDNCFDFQNLSS